MAFRFHLLLIFALLSGSSLLFAVAPDDVTLQAYVKAANTASGDEFGTAVAVSGDTMVVGAPLEDGAAVDSGAVYVYVRMSRVWTQQAYLKAANAGAGDRFGYAVAISGDTLVVGAHAEDSLSTGVDGDGSDNAAQNSGAAYVFTRSNGVWTQQAYLKASNTGAGDAFGLAVAIHDDTVAVGAWAEDGPADAATSSGAVYVFARSGVAWSQQAYLRAANAEAGDQFGFSVAIDGDALLVGAPQEDSAANSVDGNAASNTAPGSGAAYLFARAADTWSPQAYLKAGNSGSGHQFGFSVSLSGELAAVGANLESANTSGAAYLFRNAAGSWAQEAYLKASNPGVGDHFGQSVAVSGDALIVAAPFEDSYATGVYGNETNNIAPDSGACYFFQRVSGTWSQQAYAKAGNTGAGDQFGRAVALSARTAVCGASYESSAATGVDGDGADNSAPTSGAAYVFVGAGPPLPEPELDVALLEEALADEGSLVNFGLVRVGAPPVAKTFTLTNNGAVPLLIGGVSVSGDHAADFTAVTAGLSTTLAPGEETTLSVNFVAAAIGVRLATLVINSNDSDEDPYQIDLTGAVLPRLNVSGDGLTIRNGDPSPSLADHTDLGTAILPDGQVTRTFHIANNGTADLLLGAVEITGSQAADFAVSAPPVSPVAPGTFSTLEITFAPSALGARLATVAFTSNDGPRSPFTFAIQGSGTGPGLPDATFGSNGRVITGSAGSGDERAYGLAVQADGRVVVAGSAEIGIETRFALYRYLSDGTPDPSFGTGGTLALSAGIGFSQANSVAVQPDGRIVAAGLAFNGVDDDFVIVRRMADGSPDASFGAGSGRVLLPLGPSDDRAYGVALQPDGKILVAGSSHDGTRAEFALVRLLADGTPDPAFGTSGTTKTPFGSGSAWSYSLALQRDGKIVAVGEVDGGLTRSMAMARYLGNGSLDTGFGTGGRVVTASGISDSAAYSVAIRRDGRIVLGGYATNPLNTDWALVRYLRDGTLDASFGTGGRVLTAVGSSYEEINSLTVQADGGIFAAGFVRNGSNDDFGVARFLANGSLDPAFGTGGKAITPVGSGNDYGFVLKVQPDGKVVVAGHTYNGTDYDLALVRYEASLVILDDDSLIITEIMYNPDSTESDWQWLEVYNPSTSPINLAGWTFDDDAGTPLGASNIAAGMVAPGGTAILYDGDALSASDFAAAWGPGINLIAVSGFPALGITSSSHLGLWADFGSYDGGLGGTFTYASDQVDFGAAGFPASTNGASIFLTDISATADNADGSLWTLSTDGGATPLFTGYSSALGGGNSGEDIGSPGDPPLVAIDAVDDAGETDEDTVLTSVLPDTTTTLLANDLGIQLMVTGHDLLSTLGATVSVDADGTFSYDPTGEAAIQALDASDSLTDTFEYTITDAAGTGTDTDTATVSIELAGVNDAPTLTWPELPDIIIETSSPSATVALFPHFGDVDENDVDTALSYTVTVNSNGALIQTEPISPVDGILTINTPCTLIGSAEITVQAEDSGGLKVSDTFLVTVKDNVDPVISGTKDIFLNAPAGGTATANFGSVTASDKVDANPTLVFDPAASFAFPIGSTLVTCTATDASNNVTVETFSVHVFAIQPTAGTRVFEIATLRDDPAPGAGGPMGVPAGSTMLLHYTGALNNAGDIIYSAVMSDAGTNNRAVFLHSGGVDVPLAVRNTAAPGGAIYSKFSDITLNNTGIAGFQSDTDLGGGHFLDDGNMIHNAATVTQIAPGTTGEYRLLRKPALTSGGDLLTVSNLNSGVGGVTSINDTGLWRTATGGATTLVAREGDASPIASTDYSQIFSRVVASADNNRFAFSSFLTEQPTFNSSNNTGLFVGTAGGSIAVVAREGDAVPGEPGAVIGSFLGEVVDSSGNVAFRSNAKGTGISTANNEGIWWTDGTTVRTIAREGSVAPCLPHQLAAFDRFEKVSICDNGSVFFYALLKNVGAVGPVNSTNDGSIWRWDSSSGDLHLVVSESQVALGTDGAIHGTLYDYDCNQVGGIVYLANFVANAGDTTSVTRDGVWLARNAADVAPVLVLRRGDKFDIGGLEHTITNIKLDAQSNPNGGTGGYGKVINDSGEILLNLSLDRNKSGLFKMTLP